MISKVTRVLDVAHCLGLVTQSHSETASVSRACGKNIYIFS